MSRGSVALLSSSNLLHNVQYLQRYVAPAQIIAMVKADGYGHGGRCVAELLDPHVALFGVACIDEALSLLAGGLTKPMLLMEGVFSKEELELASLHHFHVVFHTPKQIEWLESFSSLSLHVWMKIDTGLERLGFSDDQAIIYFSRLRNNPQVVSMGILSHFACADLMEHPLNHLQWTRFQSCMGRLQYTGPKSLCNSAAMLQFPHAFFDYVRPGIALYGVSPFANKVAESLGFFPVMTVQTRVIALRYLVEGSSTGYGARFTCSTSMPIAILSFGYGDGYPITARDGTPVLIRGVRCPLVGRVSMDMMAVDVRACPSVQLGDIATLWGDGLPLEEVACHTSQIPWSILTGIQTRVRREWI